MLSAVVIGAISGAIIGGVYGGLTELAKGQNFWIGAAVGAVSGLFMGIGEIKNCDEYLANYEAKKLAIGWGKMETELKLVNKFYEGFWLLLIGIFILSVVIVLFIVFKN